MEGWMKVETRARGTVWKLSLLHGTSAQVWQWNSRWIASEVDDIENFTDCESAKWATVADLIQKYRVKLKMLEGLK